MKKTEQIHIRVTPQEKASIKAMADYHDTTISNWVLFCSVVERGNCPVTDTPDMDCSPSGG